MGDWRQHHANEAEKACEHELVQNVLTEFARNMGFERDGLPEYGLTKIVATVAQVARAQALGFDPDLLRLSADEADAELLALARKAVECGKPTWVIRDDDAQRID